MKNKKSIGIKLFWADPVWWNVIWGSILGFFVAFLVYLQKYETESNFQYTYQVEKLTTVGKNIKDLSTFVEEQKRIMIKNQNILKSLEKEREKLSPILEADKKTVMAILDAHEKQKNENLWIERIISFTIGIISSMFASALFIAIKRKKV